MWKFDSSVGRYRDSATGRFLSSSYVREWAQESMDAVANRVYFLAENVSALIISPDDFNTLFRAQIKAEYLRQYIAGIGGIDQMNSEHYGRVGGMLAEQYRWLNSFVQEIANGLLSVDAIYQRMKMYLASSREAYERAVAFVANRLGATQEAWFLSVAEHCDDCIRFAGEGWQPFGYFPAPCDGSTICLTNCKCHKSYR